LSKIIGTIFSATGNNHQSLFTHLANSHTQYAAAKKNRTDMCTENAKV